MCQRDAVSFTVCDCVTSSPKVSSILIPSVKTHVHTPLSRRESPVYLNLLLHRGCSFQRQQHKPGTSSSIFICSLKCYFSLYEYICIDLFIQNKCVTYIEKTLKKRLLLLAYPLCQRCVRTQVSWSHSSGLRLDYTAK